MTALTGLPVVWHADCVRHEPDGEVWLGVWDAGTEVPARATILLDALTAAGAEIHPATGHDGRAITAVHDPELVAYLRTAWAEWEAAGYPREHGRRRVVPYLFPTAGLLSGLTCRAPAALHGRLGMYCYDTMTLLGPGTWEAARGAADAALTAADLVLAGAPSAYALCRPPGHHAGPSAHGGSCYLNNAAIAAQALRDGGVERVAILVLDAHHGNGTQAIFYERDDVFFGSVHVDPGAGWFPHYVGFADERGAGAGVGANRNVPLVPGAGDDEWLDAIELLCTEVARQRAEALVVSLGVDAAASDPESPLTVSAVAYRSGGERLAALGPAVVIQEGGYDLTALGSLTVEALTGFSGPRIQSRTVR